MPDENVLLDNAGEQLAARELILNNMDIALYVSDLATNQILFANEGLRKTYDRAVLTGGVCWETLKSKNGRCEFCPIPYLLKNPGKSYQWETRSGGKHYHMHDSIIPWLYGKLAHLHFMVEIF